MSDILSKIPNGSNILVRRDGFLPAGIRFFMLDRFNHTEKAVIRNGQLQTFGAIKEGCVFRPLEEAIILENWRRIQVYKPITWIDPKWLVFICEKYKGTPYQKINFLQWIIYLKYGFWIGKDHPAKMYCYECTARVCEEIIPNTFPSDHIFERTHIKDFRYIPHYIFSGEYAIFEGELYQTNKTE